MNLNKNDVIELTITDIATDGNGVGRLEGMAVFVPNTAAGDRLMVKIVKTCKNHAYGIAVQALSPSPDRVDPGCPIFRQCGGCSLRHISYEAELKTKERWVRENLRRIGGVQQAQFDPIVPSPKQSGYRNKAQYPVAEGEDGELNIGFYAKRSHRIIDCGTCDLQPPVFSEIVETIRQICRYHHIPAYDEVSRRGLIRHIYLRCSAQAEEIMVCFVLQNARLPHAQEFVSELTGRFPQIKSIVINVNSQPTNVILGRQCRTLWGSDTISDTLCGLRFSISPLSFYQVNREAAQLLYETAREFAGLSGSETLLDLYCGTGTIGLSMASHAKHLIGVEIVPQAVDDAKRNAELGGIHNARFLCADAAQAAQQLLAEGLSPDVVMIDPPRKGCEPAIIEAVASMAPQRVVLVSCNSATAARDCALFAQKGYQVTRVRPVDMFPRTNHVEVVIQMKLDGGKEKQRG